MNRKKQIKSITEAAVFVALYCLIAILTRYIITGVDSFIYYIYPLPLAIYSARTKVTYSIAAGFAVVVLSFLFTNPIYVLMLMIPNVLIGLTMGILERQSNTKIINYLTVFIISLIANFISVYAYELITGISYFQDITNFVTNFFKTFIDLSTESIIQFVTILGVTVLLIDALIKTLFLYVLFTIIVQRLKLIDNYKPNFKIPLRYSYLLSIIYIVLLVIGIILSKQLINIESIFLEIIYIFILSSILMLSFYFLYQVSFFFRIIFRNKSNIFFIIIILMVFILFPLSIILGIILNLINWNYLKALI